MNQKAILFAVSLVFMTLGALIAGFYLVVSLQQKTSTYAALGDTSKAVLGGFVKSQEVLSYIDAIAVVALHESIGRVAKEAGVNPNENTCGTLKTRTGSYVLWNMYENEKLVRCYAQEPFDVYFSQVFDGFLTAKLSQSDQEVANSAAGHYNYFIQPTALTVYGISTSPVDVSLELSSEKSSGIYAFRPSFTVQVSYDLTLYDVLHRFADTVLDACQQKTKEEKLVCINAAIKDVSIAQQGKALVTTTTQEENTFLFDVSVPHYRNPYNQEKTHAPIRFALKIL